MKRWREDMRITYREWTKHRLFHVEDNQNRAVGGGPGRREPGISSSVLDCECDEQAGRFRKKDAYDCGNSRCLICHSDKYPRRLATRQEALAKLRLAEQLREMREE